MTGFPLNLEHCNENARALLKDVFMQTSFFTDVIAYFNGKLPISLKVSRLGRVMEVTYHCIWDDVIVGLYSAFFPEGTNLVDIYKRKNKFRTLEEYCKEPWEFYTELGTLSPAQYAQTLLKVKALVDNVEFTP